MKALVKYVSSKPGVSERTIRWTKYVLNILPIIAVLLLKVWTYTIFILYWDFNLLVNGHMYSGIAFFLFYHLIAFLTLWSYFKCVFSRPPLVINTSLASSVENIRYCQRCQGPKPRRAHHCSWCERCVAKMDHHCPWLGNCVGDHNYKFFILMLGYTLILGLFVGITMTVYNKNTEPQIPIYYSLAVVGFAVGGGVSLLFSFHLYLLFTNKTTIECGINVASCDMDNPYDVGWQRNFKSVMGTNPLYWFIPIKPPTKVTEEARPLNIVTEV